MKVRYEPILKDNPARALRTIEDRIKMQALNLRNIDVLMEKRFESRINQLKFMDLVMEVE